MAEKKAKRPIYFQVRRLVDPATGEEVGALVPRFACDRRTMRERGYSVGTDVRAELKKPRNVGFHRLAHALGALASDQIEAFQGCGSHEAIKRLQRETGLCCEQQEIEIPGIGRLQVNVARSIAFDEMDQGEFTELYRGICRHIAERYWPSMTEDQISGMAELMETT